MNEIANSLLSGPGDPNRPDGNKKNTLGKDDFMKLLMTQLRHQDPLKPMDHQEFAQQLAQFGSLEQLTNIGSGIQSLKNGMGDDSKLKAVALIGKRIDASGNDVDLTQGQPVNLSTGMRSDLTPIKATIYDPNGKVIREMDLVSKGNAKDGEIAWDGKSQDGTPLPSGKYSFRIYGIAKNGQTQEMAASVSGKVTGVEFEGQTPMLVVQTPTGNRRMDMAKVKQVMVDSESAPTAKSLDGASSIPGIKPLAAAAPKVVELPKLALPQSEEGSEPELEPVNEDVGERPEANASGGSAALPGPVRISLGDFHP